MKTSLISKPEPLSDFSEWLQGDLGRTVLEIEEKKMASLLPTRYFNNVVQFGSSFYDVTQNISTSNRKTVGYFSPSKLSSDEDVLSDFRTLPFAAHCIDLAILPHTLDFVENPHQFLRELTQTMRSDGTILLSGFQPFSFWGLSKAFRFSRSRSPWCGRFLTTSRVQDWLSLMGYRIEAGGMTMYRPPLSRLDLFHRLEFLESAGDRWWPMFGAVYIIVARLQTLNALPVSKRRVRRSFSPSIVQTPKLAARDRVVDKVS